MGAEGPCSMGSSAWRAIHYLFEAILGRLHEGRVESPTDSKGGDLHSPPANGLGLHLCQHCLVARHHPPLHHCATICHTCTSVWLMQSCLQLQLIDRRQYCCVMLCIGKLFLGAQRWLRSALLVARRSQCYQDSCDVRIVSLAGKEYHPFAECTWPHWRMLHSCNCTSWMPPTLSGIQL